MVILKNDALFLEAKWKLNSDYCDEPMTVSEDQSKCIIMRINDDSREKDFINRMKLCEGEYKEGKWIELKELPFNSDSYNTDHPSCGKDENELFFVSPKNILYKTIKNDGGRSKFKNLIVNEHIIFIEYEIGYQKLYILTRKKLS
jgi:hypothetical protein